MSVIDVTVQVVDGVDTIAINYDNQVTSMTVTEVRPEVQIIQSISPLDEISIGYDDQVTSITVTEVMPQIQVINVDAGEATLIYSVNDLIGSVNLTYKEVLSYVQQQGGIYTYQVSHNLNYDTPMVMVYNNENDVVVTEVEIVDNNTINVISTGNLNGFRVVVQR